MNKGKNCFIIFVLLAFYSINPQNNVWELRNGPSGPWDAVSFDKNSFGYTFAGTLNNGIFFTTDNGNTWVQSNSGLTDTYISEVLVNNNGDVYTGTFSGVFRSTDNGKSWFTANIGLTSLVIQCISHDKEGNLYAGASRNKVFKSTNNGGEWSSITSDLPDADIKCILITSNGDILAGMNYKGIYRSTDNGASWIPSASGLPADYINSIAVSTGGNLFAACNWSGLYCSTDNGYNWFNANIILNQVNKVFTKDNGIVIASGRASSGEGVCMSTDDGYSWNSTDSGLIHSSFNAIGENNQGNILLSSFLGGIYISNDNGISWDQLTKEITDKSIFTSITTSNGNYFIATQSSGVFRSTDSGLSWKLVTDPLRFTSLLEVSEGEILGGTWDGEFWKSTDNGNNWTKINSVSSSIWSLTIGTNGNIFAATPNGVYKSIDRGMNWLLSMANSTSSIVTAGDKVFAGSYGEGIYLSTDDGSSWKLVNNGLTNSDIRSLSFNLSGNLYAASAGGLTGYCALYLSTNYGDNWIRIDKGLSYSDWPVVVADSNNVVYIASGNTVMKSTDIGGTWDTVGSQFPGGRLHSISIDINGYLVAADFGSGIWRTKAVTSSEWSENIIPRNFSIDQNFPNPFNPSTQINYNLPQASYVSIVVFDLLGREVKLLVNEEKPAGNYSVNFNASNISSGIYFYRIQAGSFVATKKMILMK